YNVITVLLGDGPLIDAFKACGGVIISPAARTNQNACDYLIENIAAQYDISLAIVNSIESRNVLSALSARFIPCVSLIHEFSEYTRPRHAIPEAMFWATETIFSSYVTRESAKKLVPDAVEFCPTILRQGRCVLPPSIATAGPALLEREKISQFMRA